jgi:hypothetical protein
MLDIARAAKYSVPLVCIVDGELCMSVQSATPLVLILALLSVLTIQ